MQFLLALVRLRGQDVTAKGMISNYFARASLLEPLGRTFVGLELRHRDFLDLFEQERLPNYSMATGSRSSASAPNLLRANQAIKML
jgi:hypothetical protein